MQEDEKSTTRSATQTKQTEGVWDRSKALVLRKRSGNPRLASPKSRDVHWDTTEAERDIKSIENRSRSRKHGALVVRAPSNRSSSRHRSKLPSTPILPPNRIERSPRRLPSLKIMNDPSLDRPDNRLVVFDPGKRRLGKSAKLSSSLRIQTTSKVAFELDNVTGDQPEPEKLPNHNSMLRTSDLKVPAIFTWDVSHGLNEVDLSAGTAVESESHEMLTYIREFLFPKIRDSKTTPFVTVETVQKFRDEFLEDVNESDRQKYPCNYTLMMTDFDTLFNTILDIYSFFIPLSYSGDLSQYFWGQVLVFFQVRMDSGYWYHSKLS